jgi:hypothetical protein
MSGPTAHFIPHPLTRKDPKTIDVFLSDIKKEWETIEQYVRDSKNPQWAASHLVRAIADGLYNADIDAADQLREIANQLATRRTT